MTIYLEVRAAPWSKRRPTKATTVTLMTGSGDTAVSRVLRYASTGESLLLADIGRIPSEEGE